jgi:hypothetical protein
MGWDPDGGGPLPLTDWIICHDNWATTPVNVAIPWVDSLWIATFTADPGADTILPYIACVDTTVYLDGNGQFYLDESYIVDSAWDNNGVEQLFLNEYYVTCLNTAIPETITATAMDMFGNMAQCTASVTVLDTIPPTAACTDTTVYLDATGNVTIDSSYVDDGSTDNCGISSAVLSRTGFDTTDLGILQPVTLTVYDASGNSSSCQVSITVLDTITSSIDDELMYDHNFEFSISPNPSDGIIHIESKSPVQDCTLEIYNISGALLLNKILYNSKTELYISNFTKGVYILKVKGKEGREYRERLIIK